MQRGIFYGIPYNAFPKISFWKDRLRCFQEATWNKIDKFLFVVVLFFSPISFDTMIKRALYTIRQVLDQVLADADSNDGSESEVSTDKKGKNMSENQ